MLRTLGTLLVVAGVGLLAWSLVVWRWQDPVTALYTAYEQRQLAASYEQRAVTLLPRATTARRTPVRRVSRAELAALARRYRASAGRGDAIARIRVPRIGVDMVVVNGTDSETLKRGPGRYLGSFMPGEGELVYVAGHRTTFGAPFARIDALGRGDRVVVELPYATFEYRVERETIVRATAVEVLRSRGREVLALQACHPRFFASHRYIVYARPVSVRLPGGHVLGQGEALAGTPLRERHVADDGPLG